MSLSLSPVSSPLNPCHCECMLFSCSSSHCICFILLMSCHSCLFIQCMQSFKRSSNQLFIQESWAIHANKIHINKQAHYTMHKVLVPKTSLHKPLRNAQCTKWLVVKSGPWNGEISGSKFMEQRGSLKGFYLHFRQHPFRLPRSFTKSIHLYFSEVM